MGGVLPVDVPVRMGLVGLGSMGRHHARVIRETQGLDLVAVADPYGDRHGVARGLDVLPDVAALVEAGIDAAMVAVPTYLHEEVALALAGAGVHTMVEKPIAATAESGRRVAAAFAEAGLVGCVGYVERCNPALLEMRRRIEAGELGEVYQITTSRQGPFPARIADVGVVKDLATHDIDLAAWIAQSPYAVVSGQVTHRSGREHEDMVVASGRLANGIIVSHVVNWLSPRKVRETVATGEKGSFIADTLTGDLTFVANGDVASDWDRVSAFRGVSEGDSVRYAIAKREPLRVEQENFRDALWGRPEAAGLVVSMDEGVHTLTVVEAILESAGTDRTITL
ncbi:Gfo/Idh/MocA family protein [Ornithinimicrobium sediminis]|uniref:Gfo/Idh/MocA family protein n=1 Tax=Ornithinimicrobium sediminis TaxID=2904603 RepID=UPI001E2E9654|nr:Gfo/Idh/MocA family oxidoreductase [Ornithinimicrobium sediminis]MCE0487866.1 Gfo/Idh/MocA family oxidoreductase [Ornithinimicrobium sediminis]